MLRKQDGGEVHVLGTCHSSAVSAAQAAELVQRVKPSAVVLELCSSRRHMLYEKETASTGKPKGDSLQDQEQGHSMSGVASDMYGVLTDWTSIIPMQYAALDSLEAPKAGGEFRAAARAAEAPLPAAARGPRLVPGTT